MTQPPPLTSDGHNGCGEAMKAVWGEIPPYKGVGPRPKYKAAKADWQYLKVIKNKQPQADLEGTQKTQFCEKQVVFGDKAAVLKLLDAGTVHVERTHLTMRNFNARLTRKGLGMSKKLEMHEAAAAWEDAFYNLCHQVRTLKLPIQNFDANKKHKRFEQKWQHRTPMMAANITDHTWSVKELIYSIKTRQLLSG
jgi:IS1 family transposase